MRYCIIDFMHLAYKATFSGAPVLTKTINIDGVPTTVQTTVAKFAIRDILKFARYETNFIGVCFDGGSQVRRDYFSAISGEVYKGNRKKLNPSFIKQVETTAWLLLRGGVSAYRVEGYEADDLAYSLVRDLKDSGVKEPIDVFTNDNDLLPLVDDQVSVYIRSNRTYASYGCPEYRQYYQVTPDSWDDYISYTSQFKDYIIPYNSMILFKLLKGDKSDCIKGAAKGFGPKGYNSLMGTMLKDEVPFETLFRYDLDYDRDIYPTLSEYLYDDVLDPMRLIYNGLKLRRIADMNPMEKIYIAKLQLAVGALDIQIVK